jgi:hypothetical protein
MHIFFSISLSSCSFDTMIILVGIGSFYIHMEYFMDDLINFMNNIHYLSRPLFLFSLITTPSLSHIHFSLPILKFNYHQEEFNIEAV